MLTLDSVKVLLKHENHTAEAMLFLNRIIGNDFSLPQ